MVACAAALATTTYMRTHDITANVQARSEQIFAGLRAIQNDTENGGWMIEEVRGQGVSQKHFVMVSRLTVGSSWWRWSSRTPTRL